ncbi:MAG: hypothetical protein GXP27_05875 [Planctomycetes bacterium]|nr:hypothetical protein [Planctomycetota bacterium]
MTLAAMLVLGLGLAAAGPDVWPTSAVSSRGGAAFAPPETDQRAASPPSLPIRQPRPRQFGGRQPGSADRASDAPPDANDPAGVAASGNIRSASGEHILQLVRQKLIDYQPFRADVLETVVIGSRKFAVTGEYIQGRDLKLRLQLRLQVGNTSGSLLEVCDGQVLSTRLQIGEEVEITRRDVRQILRAAVAQPDAPANLLIAELGLGGLSGLLASLERNMDFGQARAETIDGRRFTVIEGWWSDEFRETWRKQGRRARQGLPDYVPDGVRVYLDESDFPRRFLYLKRIPGQELARPMATLDFTRVVLRTAVADDAFRFVPPDGVLPVDVTKRYLEQLRRAGEHESGAEARPATP